MAKRKSNDKKRKRQCEKFTRRNKRLIVYQEFHPVVLKKGDE